MSRPAKSRLAAWISTLIVVISTVVATPVLAIQGLDPADYEGQDIYFYNRDDQACSIAALSSTSSSSGDDNVETILRYFTGKGFSLAAAAGFVGNMTAESSLNPKVIQGGAIADDNYIPENGKGFGLVQWTYTSRQRPLVELAKSTDRPVTDLSLQLDYVWKELNGGYKSTLNALIKDYGSPLTAKQAAIIIHGRTRPFNSNPDFQIAPTLGYEASGDSDYDNFTRRRIAPAEAAYEKYRATIPDGTGLGGATTLSSSSNCSGGSATIVDGMAFPLIATKSEIRAGSVSPIKGIWCYARNTNCHHDYNAADIMMPEDTVIVAATDGTVNYTSVNGNGARCGRRDSLSIKDTNGDIWYYTHAKPNSMVVKEGQAVKAGDKLMVIGNTDAADCTGTHLHIDKLPASVGHRISCASEACANEPFIDIQPALKKLYDSLPEGGSTSGSAAL